MPKIVQTVSGRVSGLWGTARVRGADGQMHLLRLGDIVHKGDVILTTQNGIVQLSADIGDAPRTAPAVAAVATTAEIDRVIAQLNDNDPQAATAAGAAADGALGLGLRVDRVVENVTPLSFVYDTASRDRAFDVSGTAPQDAGPSLTAPSSAIGAIEQGASVGLGLRLPAGTLPTDTLRVNQVPVIGQVMKADGTVVTAHWPDLRSR